MIAVSNILSAARCSMKHPGAADVLAESAAGKSSLRKLAENPAGIGRLVHLANIGILYLTAYIFVSTLFLIILIPLILMLQ